MADGLYFVLERCRLFNGCGTPHIAMMDRPVVPDDWCGDGGCCLRRGADAVLGFIAGENSIKATTKRYGLEPGVSVQVGGVPAIQEPVILEGREIALEDEI